jgi:hypothetical protein
VWKICVIVLSLLSASNVRAAEFLFSKVSPDNFQIELQGEIRNGDYRRLIALIESSPISFLNANSIVLNSKGGSVTEALRIAEAVEKTSLVTLVGSSNICASACFLVFIAGPLHWAEGSVLIHRPYLASEAYAESELSTTTKSQRNAMINMRKYLEDRSVPASLIELMMSRASTEAYHLTDNDKMKLGVMTPSFEEAAIAQCGLSAQDFIKGQETQKQLDCTHGLGNRARAIFLKEVIGETKFRVALREFLLSKGGIELPDGRIIMPNKK